MIWCDVLGCAVLWDGMGWDIAQQPGPCFPGLPSSPSRARTCAKQVQSVRTGIVDLSGEGVVGFVSGYPAPVGIGSAGPTHGCTPFSVYA